MKTISIKRVFTVITAIILFTACAKSDQTDPDLNGLSSRIKVSARDITSEPATKTTLTDLIVSWNSGDRIGIFSPQAKPSAGGDPGVSNLVYTAQSSAVSSEFTGEMYWGTDPHEFYAYYPYTAGDFTVGNVPVTVPSVQTQTGNSNVQLADYDITVANPLSGISRGSDSDPTSVDFRFNHLFTLLDFRITPFSGRTIKEIELEAAPDSKLSVSGTVDISEPTPASGVPYAIDGATGTNKVKVSITGGLPLSPDENSPGVFMMINPGDYSSQALKINIKTEDDQVHTITRQGIDFERGTKYRVNVSDNFGETITLASWVFTGTDNETIPTPIYSTNKFSSNSTHYMWFDPQHELYPQYQSEYESLYASGWEPGTLWYLYIYPNQTIPAGKTISITFDAYSVLHGPRDFIAYLLYSESVGWVAMGNPIVLTTTRQTFERHAEISAETDEFWLALYCNSSYTTHGLSVSSLSGSMLQNVSVRMY